MADYYNESKICARPQYGITDGCPFVDNLALGVCSSVAQHVQRLTPADRVARISCWPSADGTAVAAVRIGYQSYANATSPADLGNQAVSSSAGAPFVTLDTSQATVKRVQMWYADAVDASKRAQLGRLRITLSSNTILDCGDTSLDLNAADLDNAVDPGATGGLGSILVGAAAVSSTSGNAVISINGLSLLVLRKPAPGLLSTAVPIFSSGDDCLAVGPSSKYWSCLDTSTCPTISNPFFCKTPGR
jgi:hypothetical protein